MTERVVSVVAFLPDGGVEVQWMDVATDVRNQGLLIANHSLRIRSGTSQDYLADIETLQSMCVALLTDALEDFDSTEAVDLNVDPDEDDEDD